MLLALSSLLLVTIISYVVQIVVRISLSRMFMLPGALMIPVITCLVGLPASLVSVSRGSVYMYMMSPILDL